MKRTVSFSKDTRNVFLHILTACNLRCRHCYINPKQHGIRMLPAAEAIEWLRLLADSGANLVLLGGEPTLHPDLPEIIRAARSMGYGSITVDTNGYLFHNFLERSGPDDLDYLSFSLDGATAETNDAIRGQGAYDACVAGIRKAVAKGFHTSLIYTASRDNIHELSRMPPLLAALGVRRFFIQVIGIRGKSAGAGADLQLTRNQWEQMVPPVAAAAAEMGIIVTYPKVFLAENEPFECAGLLADNYFIFPNGRVYRCPLCEDYPMHGMRIRDGGLVRREGITENGLFSLQIPEGCVINKLVQPDNLSYRPDGAPEYRIACCMLKETVQPKPESKPGSKPEPGPTATAAEIAGT